ncbi:MAG: hypothetical protein Q9M97_05605 [Candidatus Gracilibacteria bacterium]|nr:hypothetical protein [Candidatus Gracilibacteria bacterium]
MSDKLMNEFKKYLGNNGMSFLNDYSDNYGTNSPYIKYGWNEEKVISELKERKVMYYGNNTKDKKIELKQVAKKFYNK